MSLFHILCQFKWVSNFIFNMPWQHGNLVYRQSIIIFFFIIKNIKSVLQIKWVHYLPLDNGYILCHTKYVGEDFMLIYVENNCIISRTIWVWGWIDEVYPIIHRHYFAYALISDLRVEYNNFRMIVLLGVSSCF